MRVNFAGAAAAAVAAVTLAQITDMDAGMRAFNAAPSSANLAAAVTDETGTGALVFGTTPTLATPKISDGAGHAYRLVPGTLAADRDLNLPVIAGTDTLVVAATAQTLTNKTISGASNTLSNIALASLSGLATGIATWLGTPSSANLAAAITDETGSGALVFANTPALVTPVLGAATGTSLVLNGGNFSWAAAATSPSLSQADNVTNAATAQALLVQAQNATGTTATGGGLTLTSGTGTTAAGSVLIQTGGTTRLTLSPTLNTFVNPLAIGTSPATDGWLRVPFAASSITILGAKDSVAVDRILLSSNGNTFVLGTGSSYVTEVRSAGQIDVKVGAGNAVVASFAAALTTLVNPTTITKGAIAATSTDGLSLVNATAATSGVPVQYSTRFVQTGTAYNSVSTLSETQSWMHEVRPASNAGATSSTLAFARSLNGGAYADEVTISSSGTMTVTGQVTAAQFNATSASGFFVNVAGASFSSSRTDAAGATTDCFVAKNAGAAAAASQRWSPSLRFTGAGWNITAGASRVQDVRAYLLPVQQASGEPRAELVFEYQNNAGGYATLLKFFSEGGILFPTASATPPNPPAGSVAVWFDGTNLKAKNSAGTAVTWA